MRRVRLSLVLLLACWSGPAWAQGVGFTGGGALDPGQGYIGSYIESAQIANHLRLRPGIDGAFGNGTSEAIIDPWVARARPFLPHP